MNLTVVAKYENKRKNVCEIALRFINPREQIKKGRYVSGA